MIIKNSLVILLLIVSSYYNASAHDAHYEHTNLRTWHFSNGNQSIEGTYLMTKNNLVYIQDESGLASAVPMKELSKYDKAFVFEKQNFLKQINQSDNSNAQVKSDLFEKHSDTTTYLWVFSIILTLTSFWLIKSKYTIGNNYSIALLMASVLILFIAAGNSMTRSFQSNTSIAYLDSTFAPFAPEVHTYNNSTYYYVESKGIPTTHTMMVGISNHGWQQQVPIPQCYIGNNAWPIPLNPVVAANPIPVDSIHFTRGAIAIAANGVPIFNVHTNTGVDSYLDGQLDNFGGHCGRADDYHYHIAPLHLYNYTQATLPIAWGLDGFAVYGPLEPDGLPMAPLDINHGHFGTNGIYHYHGTATAPYMIGNMVGQVTEDATHQLVPQAAANPVRPALTPLNGALITSCTPNSTNNGYNLTYTLNNFTDSVVYFWDNAGHYTFNYYTPIGLTTNNYTDFIQCMVPTGITQNLNQFAFQTFYNSNSQCIEIKSDNQEMQNAINTIEFLDLKGSVIMQFKEFRSIIPTSNLPKGVYLIRIRMQSEIHTRKIFIF